MASRYHACFGFQYIILYFMLYTVAIQLKFIQQNCMIKFIFCIKMLRERNSALFLIDRTGVTEIFKKTNYLVYYI
jgi:hypothetical protein